MITAESIGEALNGKRNGKSWMCCCPAHDDKNPSLSVSDGDYAPLVKCFAGCQSIDVIAILRERGIWPSSTPEQMDKWRLKKAQEERQHQETKVMIANNMQASGKGLTQAAKVEAHEAEQLLMPPKINNLLRTLAMTVETAQKLEETKLAINDLVPDNHMTVIIAPPNGGKTTILRWVAKKLAKQGYEVFFINADIALNDCKEFVLEADKAGYTMVTPDMFAGKSMADVVIALKDCNDAGEDFTNKVFIFDTLKKCTDMINKSQVKGFMQLQRSMTSKGATIINLGHTNKYKDSDGNYIYEGVGDIRSDHDNLIYLIPHKNDDGSMVVSTNPDKVRADLNPITFNISKDREVTLQNEYIDVLQNHKDAAQFETDRDVITRIEEAMSEKLIKQCDITEFCNGHGIGDKRTRAVLKRYAETRWARQKGMDNKTWMYYSLDSTAPPIRNQNDQNGPV